jgi:hypothetical protein
VVSLSVPIDFERVLREGRSVVGVRSVGRESGFVGILFVSELGVWRS